MHATKCTFYAVDITFRSRLYKTLNYIPTARFVGILDLHVSHVGGEVQKNILSILLLAPASVGEQYCLVSPERLVASQEYSS